MTSLITDYQTLSDGSEHVELFEIDLTSRGGSKLYLTPNTTDAGSVVFGTKTFTPIPIVMSSSQLGSTGTLPQPQLSVGVTESTVIRSAISAYGDLAGVPVTRYSTRKKYLDAASFTRYNLLNYSEDFSQANWGKSNATITANAAVAPDGTMTADYMTDNATNAQHYIAANTSAGTFVVGDVAHFSVYIKYAGMQYALLYAPMVAGIGGGGVLIDTQTGAILGLNTGANLSNVDVTDVGNGWFKVQMTTGVTTTSVTTLRIFLTATASVNAPGYVGTGTSGIYIWGAQVQKPSTATIDASLMTVQQTTIALNSAGTLDPVGLNGADVIADNTSLSTHYASQTISGFAANQRVSFTISVKAGSVITAAMIRFLAGGAISTTCLANINLSTGVVVGTQGPLSETPIVVAQQNGFYRITITTITNAAGSVTVGVFLLNSVFNNTYTGTGAGIYVWNGRLNWDEAPKPYQMTTTSHQPFADPTAISPVDSYIISQLVDFGPETVTWKLCTPIDRPNLRLPRLQYLPDAVGQHVYAPGLRRVQ